MNRDFKDLLAAFAAHDVRFLVVGAYAVTFHTRPRFTNDLDKRTVARPQDLEDVRALEREP